MKQNKNKQTHKNKTKAKMNQRNKHLLTTLWLMPSSSPSSNHWLLATPLSLCSENDSVVCNTPLFSSGPAYPGCAPSQLLVQLLTCRAWKTKKSLTWSKHYSAVTKKHQCAVNIFLMLNPKYSAVPVSTKKINYPSQNQDVFWPVLYLCTIAHLKPFQNPSFSRFASLSLFIQVPQSFQDKGHLKLPGE